MTASTTREAPDRGQTWAPAPPTPQRTLLISAPEPVDPRRVVRLVVVWSLIALLSMGVTLYLLGPLFQQRAQHERFEAYRGQIARSSEEAFGLDGVSVPTKAPELGAPVGILEVGSIQLQQAVIEGVLPTQTAVGPGHVPGTAALGQKGNAVVVGRKGAFGGSFASIDLLRTGDRVLVTTSQGFVVYRVDSVKQEVLRPPGADAPKSSSTDLGDGTEAPPVEASDELDAVFGKSDDSRLTLVSSASDNPLNTSNATVVVAKMEGLPYPKTPQNGRTDSQTGLTGDSSALAAFALLALAYGATVAAAIYLYRRSSPLSAYVLTAAPIICFTVLGAETLGRLLPAWM